MLLLLGSAAALLRTTGRTQRLVLRGEPASGPGIQVPRNVPGRRDESGRHRTKLTGQRWSRRRRRRRGCGADTAVVVRTPRRLGTMSESRRRRRGAGATMKANQTDRSQVLGGDLECCCANVGGSGIGTGFYRDGFCSTGVDDAGRHTVCMEATAEFLEFSASVGNDLSTPMPMCFRRAVVRGRVVAATPRTPRLRRGNSVETRASGTCSPA